MVCRRFALVVGLMLVGLPGAFGQEEPVKNMAKDAHPSFEVATIRPTTPGDQHQGFHLTGRSIFIENETVTSLIMFAYAVHKKQIVNGPDWFGTDPYDIKGVPDVEGQPSLHQQQEMLQKLLEERFKLKFHREKRELPIYAITVTKGGPKLAKSKDDPDGLTDQTGNGNAGQMSMVYTNNSMNDFALGMQYFMDRPVVDQTGLAGRFDFRLSWTTDSALNADPNAAPGLFTAMQEELGLKMEPVKGEVEVLVIDHAERPSAN